MGEDERKQRGGESDCLFHCNADPNIAPEATKEGLTLAAIKEIVGTGALYVDPLEAKRIKLPMAEKWDDLRKEYNGRTANPIKSAELNGKPFGSHKIMLAPTSVKGMHFHWEKRIQWNVSFSKYLSFLPDGRSHEGLRKLW